MPKSKIEWTDFTINPVKGKCPVACPYCYARKMYDRFKWDPELRFDPTVFNNLPTKPAKVFVGSTMELFLPECEVWLEKTFDMIKPYKWLTFQFLTKQPQNLVRWSPFPENCWVGVTADTQGAYASALVGLATIEAKVKFISFEPLLVRMPLHLSYIFDKNDIDWVIIGSQTNPYYPPRIEWVEEIVKVANKAEISVFQKDNLKPLLGNKLRQKLPNVRH